MPVPVSANASPIDPLGGRASAPIAPNVPFLLVHHAGYDGSWRIETVGFDAPTWVPAVDHFVLAPGANGVQSIAEGQDPRDAYQGTRELLGKQGIVQIDIPGAIVGEACACPRSHKTGTFYRTAWEHIEPPPNPQASAKVRLNRAEWNRWRAELARDGVIKPPHESIFSAARKRLNDALHQARSETRVAPDVRDNMIAKALADLDVFDKAVKPWEAAAPEKAKRGAA